METVKDRPPVHSWIMNPWLLGIVLVVLTAWAYLPAIHGDFLWDDETHLTDNIVLQANGLYRVWFTTDTSNYWPLTFSSYWIEHRIWGLNPTVFHVTNLVIHILCCLLIWRVLIELEIPGAWLAATVFAVHPVNVETVAWIAQRKNLLSMLFYLTALAMYFRFEKLSRLQQRGNRLWYWLAVAAFWLAMLSKGGVVTMPIVLLVCVWWQNGAIRRQDVMRSLPFFGIAVLMGLVEVWFQYHNAIRADAVRDHGFLARLACSGWVVWFYLYKAVIPVNLCFVYPRWEVDATNWISYVPGFLLVGVLVSLWRFRETRGRPALFALLYYVITLGPFLGFLNIYFFRYSFVADHYQHVSIIAVIALAVAMSWGVLKRLGAWERPTTILASVVLLVLLSFASRGQSAIYQDETALWTDTLEKNHACWLGHNYFAHTAYRAGRLEEAESHQLAVLKYEPKNWRYYMLGLIYFEMGDDQRAVEAFQTACSFDPTKFTDYRWATYSDAHFALALLLLKQERREEAMDHLKAALRNNPGHTKSREKLQELQSEMHSSQ